MEQILLAEAEILYYCSGEHLADELAMDGAAGPRIPHLSEKERELCVAGRMIAKTQLKRVVEWLHQDIRREIHKDGEVVVFRAPAEEWQALLKEVEE